MHPDIRQDSIVELAQREGYVAIEDLARRFDVTPQTIRRDVNDLCRRGLLQRFHGGAGPGSSIRNVDYRARQSLAGDAKRRIGELVADAISDDLSLFLNIGTTTEAVARALVRRQNLHVITNNLNVASFLSSNTDFQVIIAGGQVRNLDGGIIGEATIDFVRQFKVDAGIIGISGIDADGSLLDFDYREVRVAQEIMRNARKIYLVADHTKFGRNALVRLGHIADVTALFTDRPPPEPVRKIIEEAGVALHVCDPAEVEGSSASTPQSDDPHSLQENAEPAAVDPWIPP